ncbi:hypothetical protein [Ralstonia solanacearum]|uniref:hypothetical protein n=1 Tax=Ralstonia solanacearum TaxID=305 RepID=UPI0012DA6A81|nr:hypothetical protein [Ralstonia solanacearum]
MLSRHGTEISLGSLIALNRSTVRYHHRCAKQPYQYHDQHNALHPDRRFPLHLYRNRLHEAQRDHPKNKVTQIRKPTPFIDLLLHRHKQPWKLQPQYQLLIHPKFNPAVITPSLLRKGQETIKYLLSPDGKLIACWARPTTFFNHLLLSILCIRVDAAQAHINDPVIALHVQAASQRALARSP